MKTTREQRAAFVADVNANLAVDNLRVSAASKKLDDLYIAGKVTNDQIIAAMKNHYAAKYLYPTKGADKDAPYHITIKHPARGGHTVGRPTVRGTKKTAAKSSELDYAISSISR
jgi:hypothetical protein